MVAARSRNKSGITGIQEPAPLLDAPQRIVAAVCAIPLGKVASYGQIAVRAGLPGRARLVARVLAQSTESMPWHRVVRAGGSIAFPAGSAQAEDQRARLCAEGVQFKGLRVLDAAVQQDSLDALLFGPRDE